MSCRTETKYLTINFIYNSRILRSNQSIIVCSDDKLENIYNEITQKLLINHTIKDSKKFFNLYCNSKLCNNVGNKTYKEIFDISPFVINIIFNRDFFSPRYLIPKSIIDKRKLSSLEEVSAFDYMEDLMKNEAMNSLKKNNLSLFKIFLKLKVREDIIITNLMNEFAESVEDIGIDISHNYIDIANELCDELANKTIMKEKQPFLFYYSKAFEIEQLKSVLPKTHKNIELIKKEIERLEEYGGKIGHPGCLAEFKFREIILNEYSFHKLIDFIENSYKEKDNLNLSILNKYSAIYDFEKIKKNLSDSKLKQTRKILFSSSSSTLVTSQAGGNKDSFANITRLLEIQAEPRHDFIGERADDLPESIKSKPDMKGDATGEQSKFNDLQTKFRNDNISLDNLIQGDHEAKYFTKFFKSKKYHNTDEDTPIYNKFRFFRITDDATLTTFNNEATSLSIDESEDNIKYFKEMLLEDKIKHFLFDTSGSITGTSTFKNCMRGDHKDCLDGKHIDEIFPVVKLWDPSTSRPTDHVRTLNDYKDGRDNENFKIMLKSLFMSKDDDPNEFKSEESNWTENMSWKAVRSDLLDTYSIKYNDGTIADGNKNKFINLKFKHHEDIIINGGLSVNELSTILNILHNTKINNVPKIETAVQEKFSQNKNLESIKKIVIYLYNNYKDEKTQINKIILDMKKSGDWGMIKWISINNTYDSNSHKTILYSGDILCSLFGILNDIPVLFGTTFFGSQNPFRYLDTSGELKFLAKRTLGYYKGGNLPLSSDEINRSLFTFNKKIFNVEESDTYHADQVFFNSQFSNMKRVVTSDDFTNLYKNLFDETTGIIKKCFDEITRYKEATLESEKKEWEPKIKKILNNLLVISDSLVKLNSLCNPKYLENVVNKSTSLLRTLLDFTTSYNYIGLTFCNGKPYLPNLVKKYIKDSLLNIGILNSKAEEKFTELQSETGINISRSRKKTAKEAYEKLIGQIIINLNEIVTLKGGEEIEDICNQIFPSATAADRVDGIESDNVMRMGTEHMRIKNRMAHFVKDLSSVMSLLHSSQEFIAIFETYPNLISSIGSDVNELEIIDNINFKDIGDLITSSKQKIINNYFSQIDDIQKIKKILQSVKQIYSCISNMINNEKGKKLVDNKALGDTLGITDEDSKSKYRSLVDIIDSNNDSINILLMNLNDVSEPDENPIKREHLSPEDTSDITSEETTSESDTTEVPEPVPEGFKEKIEILELIGKEYLLDYIWSNTNESFWESHKLTGTVEDLLDKSDLKKGAIIEIIRDFEMKKPSIVLSSTIKLLHVINERPNKIKIGSVIAILDDKVSESSAKIVGLGIVERVMVTNNIVFFKVLHPYLEIETNEIQEKKKMRAYFGNYLKTCELTKSKNIILNTDGDNVLKKYGGDRENKVKINTNSLVLVIGEGNRNAAIGLVYEGVDYTLGKYKSLKIRILTEFEGDDGNIYDTESYINVGLNDIKLITPDDILGEDFLLQPEKSQ